jgi:hypothetical protein
MDFWRREASSGLLTDRETTSGKWVQAPYFAQPSAFRSSLILTCPTPAGYSLLLCGDRDVAGIGYQLIDVMLYV